MTAPRRQRQSLRFDFSKIAFVISLLGVLMVGCGCSIGANAFIVMTPARQSTRTTPRMNESVLFMALVEEADDIEVPGIEDKNGKSFQVGSPVRVCKENVKAYQVPAKFHGENGPYMVLPVGLEGKVSKVFDKSKISANFPVQVKFTPGEITDGGVDSPAPFTMHFGTNEVEMV